MMMKSEGRESRRAEKKVQKLKLAAFEKWLGKARDWTSKAVR